MGKPLRVLMVEDSEADSLLLAHELRQGGYDLEYTRVDTEMEMRAALDSQMWDLVISDYGLPQFGAPEALQLAQERQLDVPFIIVSGTIGEEKAVAALLAGAHDFISKDNLARLIPAIERELREVEVRHAKRKSDEALRESEARYRHLFESNPLPLWVFDVNTLAFLAVNDAAVQHYGYSRDEFLSMTIRDIRPAEDIPALLKDLSAATAGLSETRTWRHKKKDGTIIEVEITAHDIEFGSRKARLVLSNDVTERNRAQARLKRYTERLEMLHAIDRRILTAQSPEKVCEFALEFIVSQMALWGASIIIFDPEAESGTVLASYSRVQTPWSVGTKLSLKTLMLNVIEALQQGQLQFVDDAAALTAAPPVIREMQAGGLRSYVIIPLIAQGKLIGSLNLASDQPKNFTLEQIEMPREVADQLAITIQQSRLFEQIQRHAAELEQRVIERTAELQRAKERVEVILNNISDAIILSSFDGVIQQVNPAFHALFGYDNGDIYQQSLLILANPDGIDALLEALRTVVNTGASSRVEIAGWHPNGTPFTADVVMAAVLQDGKVQGVVCGLRDITERKQMEQGLRTALEKEKELNELKSQFTSMVSHEFRTPLSVILSSANLLQRYSDRMNDQKKEEHLNQIQGQVGRMVAMLDDVLLISRAEKVSINVSAEPVDLEAVCTEVVHEIQQTTQQHRIAFSVSGHCKDIYLDTRLIRQAITNLLTNAVKYSPEGGTVSLDLICEDRQLLIRIKDEGIGIPEADQKRLFETFHRGQNVGTISGTGLGLAIVKRAVEAHNGTISVESAIGIGTTFTIRIPTQTGVEEAT